MIKIILFDCDGLIIKHNKYFSQRLEDLGYKINHDKVTEFFKGEFLLCEAGKADLKQELFKQLNTWGWQGTVEELMEFWFKGEAEIDALMKNYIVSLRKQGIKCYLSTNNEKYRTEYLAKVVGLNSFLDGIYSSSNLGYLKPEVKFWEGVYKDFSNVLKNEILAWDDQESTINSAREFGINAEFYKDFGDFKKVMLEKYNLHD